MTKLRISEPIPTQNVTDREHWAKRRKRKAVFKEQLVLEILTNFNGEERKIIRSGRKGLKINIHSQRRRRIEDDANLVGGCKAFVDVLTELGIIYDDADKYVGITYSQATGTPYYTEVTIGI